MTDMSPEELRFEAYEAQKNENFQDYVSWKYTLLSVYYYIIQSV